MSAWVDKSEQIDALAAAWVKASGEMEDITKGKRANVGQYAYAYADLADALAMARPILARHGLMVTQTAESDERDVTVSTTMLHSSGQYVTTAAMRLPAGKTPQQAGSAVTYARRYALMAMLGLATEDDDGQSAGTRPSEAARTPREPRKQSGGSTTPAKQDARSDAERETRAIIATLSKAEQQQLRADFTETFGTTLAQMPVEQHADALEFVREIVAAYNAADAAWSEQAES